MDQSTELALTHRVPAFWPAERPGLQYGSPEFWRAHLRWPLLAFAVFFSVLEVFSLDRVLAREWYFNVHTGTWLGADSGAWWARGLLHTGGRWFVRGVAAAVLASWLLSFVIDRWRHWRLPAGYVLLSMLLGMLIVGGLKAVTNVDCPWDLAGFGGHSPYIALFGDRPDALPRARCFPGAHASSGFALFSFYFLFHGHSRRVARWMLASAVAVGVVFSVGQEARGAHFLSHHLTSAAIVWFVQLALYAEFRRRLASGSQARAAASSGR